VEGHTLTLAATNDRVSAVGKIRVIEGEDWEGIIQYSRFFGWLNSLADPGDNLHFSPAKKLNCKLDKNRRASFAISDSFYFPKVFDPPDEIVAKINRKSFGAMVRSVASLASTEAHNDVLRYAVLEIYPDRIAIIATDGVKFGYQKNLINDSERATFYINSAALLGMDAAIGGEAVDISFNNGKVFFNSGNIYTYAVVPKSIKYPDVQVFFTQDLKHKARLPRDSFINALRASAAFADRENLESKQAVIRILEDGVSISADRGETGGNETVIPLGQEAIINPNMRLKVNVEELIAICERIDSLFVWIYFEREPNGAPKPMAVTGMDDSQRFVLAVINDAVDYKLEQNALMRA
jgi:DNA polymerase III sliding clamp (beta) subunit (PCNA family)